jgi:hypothetical protein
MKKRLTTILLGSALALVVSLPAGTAAFGDDAAACHKRLEGDKARLDHDSAKYGEHSRRVDKDVDRLDADRQWCREHHSDWDHSLFDVGIYVRH